MGFLRKFCILLSCSNLPYLFKERVKNYFISIQNIVNITFIKNSVIFYYVFTKASPTKNNKTDPSRHDKLNWSNKQHKTDSYCTSSIQY